jgi:hypothetical protein
MTNRFTFGSTATTGTVVAAGAAAAAGADVDDGACVVVDELVDSLSPSELQAKATSAKTETIARNNRGFLTIDINSSFLVLYQSYY